MAQISDAQSSLVVTCPKPGHTTPTLMVKLSDARMASLPRAVQSLMVTDSPYALFTPVFTAKRFGQDTYLEAVRLSPTLQEGLQRARTVDLVVEQRTLATFALTNSRQAIAQMLQLCERWDSPAAPAVAETAPARSAPSLSVGEAGENPSDVTGSAGD